MNKNTIKITKKENKKGEDGNKVISIRIKDDILEKLEKITKETNRSRNELINILLQQALENVEILK